MSDFRIKESVLNVQYGYENEQMFIDGQYSVNQTEGTLLHPGAGRAHPGIRFYSGFVGPDRAHVQVGEVLAGRRGSP